MDYFYGPDEDGIAVPGPDDAGAVGQERPDVAVRPGADASQGADAGRDGGSDARAEDARVEAGGDGGSDDDAGRDASSDAADSAPSDDAGPDSSMPDAADAGKDVEQPPAGCVDGAYRCDAYQHQLCTGGAWQWQVGDQTCCHDGRFTVAGNVVTDGTSGKRWYRFGGRGAGNEQTCGAVLAGGRLPTVAELSAIVIGRPVNNRSVCSPTVDQQAFQNAYAGDATASDGCVDLVRGVSKAACSDDVGFLCIAD